MSAGHAPDAGSLDDKHIANRLDRWFTEGLHAATPDCCPYAPETLVKKWWLRGAMHAAGWSERDKLKAANALMAELLEGFVDITHAPEKNCSCHISPPCNDCVDHEGTRELLENSRAALTKHKGATA